MQNLGDIANNIIEQLEVPERGINSIGDKVIGLYYKPITIRDIDLENTTRRHFNKWKKEKNIEFNQLLDEINVLVEQLGDYESDVRILSQDLNDYKNIYKSMRKLTNYDMLASSKTQGRLNQLHNNVQKSKQYLANVSEETLEKFQEYASLKPNKSPFSISNLAVQTLGALVVSTIFYIGISSFAATNNLKDEDAKDKTRSEPYSYVNINDKAPFADEEEYRRFDTRNPQYPATRRMFIEEKRHWKISEDSIMQEIKRLDSERITKLTRTSMIKEVPILMYHIIGDENQNPAKYRYTISPENLKKSLDELYKNDFYVISAKEYVENDFLKVPYGKKPVVLTYDDAAKGQFDYLEDGSGKVITSMGAPMIDPNCAVAIMDDYFKMHPDFGKGAIFFVNFYDETKRKTDEPFEQEGYGKIKLKRLLERGYEIGNHTYSHINLSKASLKEAITDLKIFDIKMLEYLGEDAKEVRYLSLPFGAKPKNPEVIEYIQNRYSAIFDAWGMRAPTEGFSGHNIKGIQRIEMKYQTLSKYVINPLREKRF